MDAVLNNWRNVLFSISSGALSDAEKEQLARVECSWVHLNTRLGRFFIDIIGPVNRLQNIQDKLVELGRDPIVIGIFKCVDVTVPVMVDVYEEIWNPELTWDEENQVWIGGFVRTFMGQVEQMQTHAELQLQGAANNAEWLKVARDVKTYNPDGTLLSSVRPTQYVNIHSWAGWPNKTGV